MVCKLCEKYRRRYPLIKKDEKKVHKIAENIYSSPIECAFENSNIFSKDNWMCETLGRLRDIAGEGESEQNWKTYYYRDDIGTGSIGIIPIPEQDDANIGDNGFLIMTWYKSRGMVDKAFVVGMSAPIVPLTLELAEYIIKCYEE